MALLVEVRYEKPEILEAYLNEIYLGQRGATAVHGFGEAARLYFGKDVADLSVAESAMLAAIIQSPNRLAPHCSRIDPPAKRVNPVLEVLQLNLDNDLTHNNLRTPLPDPQPTSPATPDPSDE